VGVRTPIGLQGEIVGLFLLQMLEGKSGGGIPGEMCTMGGQGGKMKENFVTSDI